LGEALHLSLEAINALTPDELTLWAAHSEIRREQPSA
jgi:hypothetical protein